MEEEEKIKSRSKRRSGGMRGERIGGEGRGERELGGGVRGRVCGDGGGRARDGVCG